MQLADMYFPAAVEAAGAALDPSSLAWPELVSHSKQVGASASKVARGSAGKSVALKKPAQKRNQKPRVPEPEPEPLSIFDEEERYAILNRY